jgi:hypothetical protein
MPLPLRVYKYEPFSARSLQNLKEQVIYFGSPMNFNDPYDCALSPSVKEPSDDEIERIRSSYLSKPDLEPKVRGSISTSSTTALRVMLLRIGKKLLDIEILKFLSTRGISCFSEVNNSLLMWSHYSGHFKGFCLEFRTDLDLFQKLRRVRYTAQMPEVDIVPMLCDDDFEQVLDLYCTKALDWQYEQEWRCIHSQGGTAYTYPTDALTGIYMGPEMPFSAFEIIALILAGQNSHVQLWQGRRSKSEFTVDFEPVTYTSHLEARRLGILPRSDA